ncbi:GNAT family N-acetyltransferase [Aeromonas diversa]|uniref:GNAT family N-acetyltransferase n=1 Tax=Aeromonas diversa TaxID=502790 RepID=UPI0039A13EFD
MTLNFSEFFDPDLTLIRDFYERVFSRYDPDLSERIFIAKDSHWLVGVLRMRAEESYYHLCGLQLLPHYQHRGIGSLLLEYACEALGDRPVLCQVLPFEREFYLRVGFLRCDLPQLPEPMRSRVSGQVELGYHVEPLIRHRCTA